MDLDRNELCLHIINSFHDVKPVTNVQNTMPDADADADTRCLDLEKKLPCDAVQESKDRKRQSSSDETTAVAKSKS